MDSWYSATSEHPTNAKTETATAILYMLRSPMNAPQSHAYLCTHTSAHLASLQTVLQQPSQHVPSKHTPASPHATKSRPCGSHVCRSSTSPPQPKPHSVVSVSCTDIAIASNVACIDQVSTVQRHAVQVPTFRSSCTKHALPSPDSRCTQTPSAHTLVEQGDQKQSADISQVRGAAPTCGMRQSGAGSRSGAVPVGGSATCAAQLHRTISKRTTLKCASSRGVLSRRGAASTCTGVPDANSAHLNTCGKQRHVSEVCL